MSRKRFNLNAMDMREKSAFLFLTILLVASCSVKEDRSECPCVLELDFRFSDTLSVRYADLRIDSNEGYVWTDTVDVIESGGRYFLSAPRTDLHIRAWAGSDGYTSGQGLLIPFGEDCPEVYMYDSYVNTEGEYCCETVFLRKNHCVMTLVTEGEGEISSFLRVKGNVAGYGESGEPMPGDFQYLLDNEGLDAGYRVVLPRQRDASLMLEVYDGEEHHKAFALGQYIVSSGYDWNSLELDDITVTLDYALTEIRLTVSGWESVFVYDMEI